ncbi:hypothetical protein GGI42DRAFT_6471 [Trichoderma sp. SZMC 28013]
MHRIAELRHKGEPFRAEKRRAKPEQKSNSYATAMLPDAFMQQKTNPYICRLKGGEKGRRLIKTGNSSTEGIIVERKIIPGSRISSCISSHEYQSDDFFPHTSPFAFQQFQPLSSCIKDWEGERTKKRGGDGVVLVIKRRERRSSMVSVSGTGGNNSKRKHRWEKEANPGALLFFVTWQQAWFSCFSFFFLHRRDANQLVNWKLSKTLAALSFELR